MRIGGWADRAVCLGERYLLPAPFVVHEQVPLAPVRGSLRLGALRMPAPKLSG